MGGMWIMLIGKEYNKKHLKAYYNMLTKKNWLKTISSEESQARAIVLIVVLFLFGVCIEIGKFFCIIGDSKLENYWDIFSGLSVTLSIWILISKELRDNYSKEERLKKEFVNTLKLFMNNLDELVIHINGFKSTIDLTLIDYLNINDSKQHELIYRLLLELKELNSFEYSLNAGERRNYVFRVTIEHILEILIQLAHRDSLGYEIQESLADMEVSNDPEKAKEFMETKTRFMYEKQLELIRNQFDEDVRVSVIRNIERSIYNTRNT